MLRFHFQAQLQQETSRAKRQQQQLQQHQGSDVISATPSQRTEALDKENGSSNMPDQPVGLRMQNNCALKNLVPQFAFA
jgi:hypothetical protein